MIIYLVIGAQESLLGLRAKKALGMILIRPE